MPSDLYRQALDLLSEEEKESFESWTEWLAGHAGLDPEEPLDGARILANLQAEAHLVGEGDFGDPAVLAELLRRCAACLAASSAGELHSGYEAACQEFAGLGLRVLRSHLPDGLLRYSPSRTLAATLVQRMLGKLARDAFDREALPPETAFVQLRDRWSPTRLNPGDRLGRGDTVFATFEHPDGAPRDDAGALSRALALPLWQRLRTNEILFEMAYPTDAVDGHKFPTVADAGWVHLFRPASEEASDGGRPSSCCGWTEPLGAYPPQPEIIHDNAPLHVLSEPPRFVGSIA
ncbi:MAG TPA: hypothetical protein VF173_07610 [Thermoanaerobaculia bacterium]|nr:hypothetical protein [Thermoanaerobaculia bacterium]